MAGSWQIKTISNFPDSNLFRVAIANSGKDIYIPKYKLNGSGASYFSNWKFDSENLVWTKLTDCPNDANYAWLSNSPNAQAVYIPTTNKIHLYGLACPAVGSSASLRKYDIQTDTWSAYELYSISGAGYIFGIYYYNNEVYLIYSNRIIKHNLVGNTYSTIFNFSPSWDYDATKVVGILDTIYLVGGVQSGFNYLSAVNLVSPVQVTLPNPMSSGITMDKILYSNAISIGSRIYIFGAYYGSGGTTKIIYFDINSNTWTDTGFSNNIGFDSGVSLHQGKIYIIGGGDSSNAGTAAVQLFSYFPDPPGQISATWNGAGPSITITWADNSNEETNYVVERKRNDETLFSVVGTLNPGTTTFVDTDPTLDIDVYSYIYRVKTRKIIL
jgi:hypothetical protein